MHFSDEDIDAIYDKAHRDNPDSPLSTVKQIKEDIIMRGVDEFLTTVTDPKRAAIVRRVGWMMSRCAFYPTHTEAILALGDFENLALESIQLVGVMRDASQYLLEHWEELSSCPNIQKTDKGEFAENLNHLSEELREFQESHDRNGVILIHNAYFSAMNILGSEFLGTLFGKELTTAVLTEVNRGLQHVRVRDMITKTSNILPGTDIPKDKMS